MAMKNNRKVIFWKLWGVPMLLGALSMFGLIGALAGDVPLDIVSCLALAVPMVVAGKYGLVFKNKNQTSK
jgi:hypothetical protein